MTVYILREEFNLPTAEEAALNPVLGVYLAEGEAKTAMEQEIARARAAGQKVWDADDEEDWYVDFHVEAHEVHPTGIPPLTQQEFTQEDFPIAERMARALGYTQTAYTSSSCLWGLYCLPNHQHHRKGVIVKTAEFGLLFTQQLEDLYLGPDGRPRRRD